MRKLEVLDRFLPWRRGGGRLRSGCARLRSGCARLRSGGARPLPREAGRRALFYLSAVVAALLCAAVLVNYVVMPIMVRRGDLVAAPDLVGRPILEAERAAAESGLAVRVDTERPDPEHPAGDVISQTPDPGVEIKRGRTVAVVLSAGIDMRRVPELTGLNARQAQLDAEREGFVVEEIVEVHTDRVERGRVVGTCPGSGAARPAGTPLSMLVSLGPRPAELVMPSLVGRTAEEARLIVEGLGLVVRSVRYERSRGRMGREVVVVQDPVSGTRVVEGEGVTLRVGSM